MLLLITYDLKSPGRDYTNLHNAIKARGAWWHHLDSTWIVETTSTPQQLYEFLIPHIDSNDLIFIVEIKRNYWGFLPKRAWEWIEQRNFGS